MQFFCYHRDREGSMPLRTAMLEEHWAYMDRFDLVERGPTLLADGTVTGSVHVVEVADAGGARAFVFDEPCYQAGAYRDVLLRRTEWRPLDLSMSSGVLGIGFGAAPTRGAGLIGSGPLLSDDGSLVVGAAVLAATEADVRAALAGCDAVEVHLWERGGRR